MIVELETEQPGASHAEIMLRSEGEREGIFSGRENNKCTESLCKLSTRIG